MASAISKGGIKKLVTALILGLMTVSAPVLASSINPSANDPLPGAPLSGMVVQPTDQFNQGLQDGLSFYQKTHETKLYKNVPKSLKQAEMEIPRSKALSDSYMIGFNRGVIESGHILLNANKQPLTGSGISYTSGSDEYGSYTIQYVNGVGSDFSKLKPAPATKHGVSQAEIDNAFGNPTSAPVKQDSGGIWNYHGVFNWDSLHDLLGG